MQIDIRGSVNVNGVLAALARMRNTDVRGALRKLRKPMHRDQRDHRDKQRGPRGPWAPLASTTLQRYARAGIRRNRRILGKLPNPRKTVVSASALVMSSLVKWSLAHQDGPTRVGHGSVLPQRQFLWISRELIREARREFLRAMWARFLGRRYP
jgi:hypothetical protein